MPLSEGPCVHGLVRFADLGACGSINFVDVKVKILVNVMSWGGAYACWGRERAWRADLECQWETGIIMNEIIVI